MGQTTLRFKFLGNDKKPSSTKNCVIVLITAFCVLAASCRDGKLSVQYSFELAGMAEEPVRVRLSNDGDVGPAWLIAGSDNVVMKLIAKLDSAFAGSDQFRPDDGSPLVVWINVDAVIGPERDTLGVAYSTVWALMDTTRTCFGPTMCSLFLGQVFQVCPTENIGDCSTDTVEMTGDVVDGIRRVMDVSA